MGSQSRAEAELKEREKRVERLHVRPLAAADAERFSQSWKTLQARFVDDPNGVGSTLVNGINAAGDLVGFYTDAAGNTDGMLATP